MNSILQCFQYLEALVFDCIAVPEILEMVAIIRKRWRHLYNVADAVFAKAHHSIWQRL